MFISFTSLQLLESFRKIKSIWFLRNFLPSFYCEKKGFKNALSEYEFIKCSQIWWDENEKITKLIKVKYKYE